MQIGYKTRLALAACTNMESFLPRAPQPLLAVVNLTENCQARCLSCNYWHVQKANLITTKRAMALVDELVEQKVQYLRWAGGEPLLRADLFQILAHIPPNRFSKIILGTNGQLVKKFANEINKSCISQISVSLDGLGDTQRRLRGIDFDTVWSGLKEIKRKRIKVVSVFTKHLAKDIEGLLDLCEGRGYNYDICLPSGVLPYSNTEEINLNLSEMWPSPQDVDKVLSALLRSRQISPSIAQGARAYMVDKVYPFRHCILGYTELRITAGGDVHTTCFELGPVGNILRTPLREILAEPSTSALTREMYRLKCSRCMVGWQTSRVFEHPWNNVSYILKRTRGNNRQLHSGPLHPSRPPLDATPRRD